MKNQVLFIFVILFSLVTHAQKVKATVDKNNILIGQQVKLRLQANFLKDEEPGWFDGTDSIPRFEILEKYTSYRCRLRHFTGAYPDQLGFRQISIAVFYVGCANQNPTDPHQRRI